MEFVKRYWTQVQAQLEGVSPVTKWLIAFMLAFLIAICMLMMLYAAAEETMPVGLAGKNSPEAIAALSAAGIQAEVDGGEVRVPAKDVEKAYLVLAQGDLFGESPSSTLDRMFDNQSPWETDARSQQRYLNQKSQFLSAVLERITRIKTADVLIDPGQDGIGKRHVPASAMVNIMTKTGPVDAEMADAVAALVSGGFARVAPADVKIVDARTGRRVEVSDPSNMLPSDAIEMKRNIEERKRREIENILDYIPGVRVGVNVILDTVASQREQRMEYEKEQLVERESTEERIRRNIADAGEPGPRSNTGLSINGSGSTGTEETENKTETSFYEAKPVVLQQETVRTGNQVKQINVAVNVPRSFFVNQYKQQNPDDENEPDDATLTAMAATQLVEIEDKVKVLTLADSQGVVNADMVPDAPVVMTAGSGSTVGRMLDSGWAGPAGISLLALASLALMFGMVRKATKPETLPSIEELAGVPPSLPSDEELIGEAEESEATMQGVELDEDDLKARRIAEQISDLVRADPSEASRLLGKWIAVDD